MSQRRYCAQQYFIENNVAWRKMGGAYKMPLNWENV